MINIPYDIYLYKESLNPLYHTQFSREIKMTQKALEELEKLLILVTSEETEKAIR